MTIVRTKRPLWRQSNLVGCKISVNSIEIQCRQLCINKKVLTGYPQTATKQRFQDDKNMLTWYYLYIIPTPSPAEKKKLKGKQRSDKNNWNLDLRDKNPSNLWPIHIHTNSRPLIKMVQFYAKCTLLHMWLITKWQNCPSAGELQRDLRNSRGKKAWRCLL